MTMVEGAIGVLTKGMAGTQTPRMIGISVRKNLNLIMIVIAKVPIVGNRLLITNIGLG
jgi:hypothetical protein